ncbi:Gcv operon repressor [Raoultella terrigena]|nr:Gcv operon repressor [Raoultella terrigena]
MTASLQHYLVITALGADRPGIVNTITRHVSSCGCNIEDSRLAMLGDEFTFIMLLSGTWNAINLIESTLPLKGAELDLLNRDETDDRSPASGHAEYGLGPG